MAAKRARLYGLYRHVASNVKSRKRIWLRVEPVMAFPLKRARTVWQDTLIWGARDGNTYELRPIQDGYFGQVGRN